MKEKSEADKIAANRQVELLTEALEQAKTNGGVWLNADGKAKPILHRKEVGVSGFNALMLGLNSDKHNFATNLYTFYSDARKLNSPVRDHERGVPFNWYNWNKYVNRNNPEDTITKEEYQKLPEAEQAQYKGVRQRETRWLFNMEQTILPQAEPERYDRLVARNGNAEARKAPSYDDDNALRIRVNDFQLAMRDNLVGIRHDGNGYDTYDSEKNVIHMSPQKFHADYPEFVQELMRNVAAATGHQQRMAREGMVATGGVAPSEDAVKQEKLIQELVSGIKMQEYGMPGRISQDNLGKIDYWVRELKENPCLIDIVERDVNNAIDLIKRAERGEKIELASKVNENKTEQYKAEIPKHFYIADEIKMHPDRDEKLFVVVKDAQLKTADVVLPAGASVERNNEVPGMNKDRITKALEKQGYDTIRFYNPDGALGYRPDDAYFAGKEVTVSKLRNWDMVDKSKIDVIAAVAQAGQMEFDRVQMVQDDNKQWALFVKPEGREAFTVYPDKADINRFFTTLKQSQTSIDDVRLELGNKYFAMTEARPELKVDIFGKGQTAEVDLNRIQKVNLFKSRNDVILCAATIEGVGRLEPKVISPQQWQRLWLAENREDYKKNLAAKLYADVLQQTRSTEQVKQNHTEEKVKVEDKPNTKSQEAAKEEQKKQEQKKQDEKKAADKLPKIPWTWNDLHKRHPDAMLMFRTGDFYSLYKEHAVKGHEILGITLDKIKDDVDRAMFPHHALDTYLPKLIRAGQRVAICDQLREPTKEEAARMERENQQENRQTKEQVEKQSHGLHL